MPNTVSKFAAWLGTVIVVLRGIPLVAHSAAHVQLAIFLPSVAANAYVVVVLFVLPVVAAVLLWTSYARAGAALLFWSMLGSLVFEVYNHFVAMSADNVSEVPAGHWGEIFKLTAVSTAILEAAGCLAAIYLLRGPLRRRAG